MTSGRVFRACPMSGTPSSDSGVFGFARVSGSEQPAHEDRGQDGRSCGRRPLENRLYGVVFDPRLIGYVYEPVGDVPTDEVGYGGREYGHEPVPHCVVHKLPFASCDLPWSVPTMGRAKTPRTARSSKDEKP